MQLSLSLFWLHLLGLKFCFKVACVSVHLIVHLYEECTEFEQSLNMFRGTDTTLQAVPVPGRISYGVEMAGIFHFGWFLVVRGRPATGFQSRKPRRHPTLLLQKVNNGESLGLVVIVMPHQIHRHGHVSSEPASIIYQGHFCIYELVGDP